MLFDGLVNQLVVELHVLVNHLFLVLELFFFDLRLSLLSRIDVITRRLLVTSHWYVPRKSVHLDCAKLGFISFGSRFVFSITDHSNFAPKLK